MFLEILAPFWLSFFYVMGVLNYLIIINNVGAYYGLNFSLDRLSLLICLSIICFVVVFTLFYIGLVYSLRVAEEMYSEPSSFTPYMEEIARQIDVLDQEKFCRAVYSGDLSGILHSSWPVLIHVLIVAPIAETVMFFAIIFTALWNKYRYWWALILTITLFTLVFHYRYFSISSYLRIAFSATVMLLLFQFTKNIVPSIVFHSAWNFIATMKPIVDNWGLSPMDLP